MSEKGLQVGVKIFLPRTIFFSTDHTLPYPSRSIIPDTRNREEKDRLELLQPHASLRGTVLACDNFVLFLILLVLVIRHQFNIWYRG